MGKRGAHARPANTEAGREVQPGIRTQCRIQHGCTRLDTRERHRLRLHVLHFLCHGLMLLFVLDELRGRWTGDRCHASDWSGRRRRLPKKTRAHHLDLAGFWHVRRIESRRREGRHGAARRRRRSVTDGGHPHIRFRCIFFLPTHELTLTHCTRAAITLIAQFHGWWNDIVVFLFDGFVLLVRVIQAVAGKVLHLERPRATLGIVRHKCRFLFVAKFGDVLLDSWQRFIAQRLTCSAIQWPASLETHDSRHVKTGAEGRLGHRRVIGQQAVERRIRVQVFFLRIHETLFRAKLNDTTSHKA